MELAVVKSYVRFGWNLTFENLFNKVHGLTKVSKSIMRRSLMCVSEINTYKSEESQPGYTITNTITSNHKRSVCMSFCIKCHTSYKCHVLLISFHKNRLKYSTYKKIFPFSTAL